MRFFKKCLVFHVLPVREAARTSANSQVAPATDDVGLSHSQCGPSRVSKSQRSLATIIAHDDNEMMKGNVAKFVKVKVKIPTTRIFGYHPKDEKT